MQVAVNNLDFIKANKTREFLLFKRRIVTEIRQGEIIPNKSRDEVLFYKDHREHLKFMKK